MNSQDPSPDPAFAADLGKALDELRDANPRVAGALSQILSLVAARLAPSPTAEPEAEKPAEPPPPPITRRRVPVGTRKLKIAGEEVEVPVFDLDDLTPAEPEPAPPAKVGPVPAKLSGPKVLRYEPPDPRAERAAQLDDWRAAFDRKAEAARWQPQRVERLAAAADSASKRAKVEKQDERFADPVRYWMAREPYRGMLVADPPMAEELADCYAAAAAAAGLLKDAYDEQPADDAAVHDAIDRLAWAQAALRNAVRRVHGDFDDREQGEAHHWLRRECADRDHYTPWLRADNDADPAAAAEALAETKALAAERRAKRDKLARVADVLDRLKGGVEIWERAEPGDPAMLRATATVHKALAAAADAGFAHTDKRLRDAVRPMLLDGDLPDPTERDLPGTADRAAVARVLAHAREMLEKERAEADAEADEEDATSPELAEAAKLLKGRVMVLVGGQAREPSRAALERRLGLRELRWRTVAHGHSFDRIRGELTKSDVDLVATLTRWSAHRDSPEAAAACAERGIPYVQLPRGYGANTVAAEVLAQAGEKLRSLPPAGG